MSYVKTAIYPHHTTNSLIHERGEGGRISAFLREKKRVKNLPIGMARQSRAGGGGLIL
jgi:hypothetical protein